MPVSQCISEAHLPGAQRTQNIPAADSWKGSSEAIEKVFQDELED